MFDIRETGNGDVQVFGRTDGWICGTPWAQPIRIPVFRDTVYRNRKVLLAVGQIETPVSEQDGAGNP